MACYNPGDVNRVYILPKRKLGLEGLIEEINYRREEIKSRFKAYLDTLQETEAMLLGDLDAILECAKKEKERQSSQLRDITATKQFIREQLKTSENELLRKHLQSLKNYIREISLKIDAIPKVEVIWKHLNLCEMISEVCYIPLERHSEYENKHQPIRSSAKHEPDTDYMHFCIDRYDNNLYLIARVNDQSKVLIFNRNLQQISTIDIPRWQFYSPSITTNKQYIFISPGVNFLQVVLISKQSKEVRLKDMDILPHASFATDEFVFSTSYADVVHKIRLSDLKIMEDIQLKGVNSFGEEMNFSNAGDIHIFEGKFYILFNSSTLRALCCFSSGGTLLREIITNARKLQNPTRFTFDKDNNIVVVDKKVRVFDHYGRQIGSFEYSPSEWRENARAIGFNPITNHIIVLTKYKDKWLHAY